MWWGVRNANEGGVCSFAASDGSARAVLTERGFAPDCMEQWRPVRNQGLPQLSKVPLYTAKVTPFEPSQESVSVKRALGYTDL